MMRTVFCSDLQSRLRVCKSVVDLNPLCASSSQWNNLKMALNWIWARQPTTIMNLRRRITDLQASRWQATSAIVDCEPGLCVDTKRQERPARNSWSNAPLLQEKSKEPPCWSWLCLLVFPLSSINAVGSNETCCGSCWRSVALPLNVDQLPFRLILCRNSMSAKSWPALGARRNNANFRESFY